LSQHCIAFNGFLVDIETLKNSAFYSWLLAHPDWITASIGIIAFVESFAIAGIIVPGVALLAVAAFVAGSGDINIYMVLASAWLGAVLGDVSSFFIGRYFSDSLLNWRLLQSQRDWIIRGEAFFERYGIVSIVIGRFIGPIRPVMPLSAGILGMPTTPFIAVNLASALAWAPVYILPGYLLGASVDTGYSSTELGLIVLAALAVLLAFFYWVRHHFKF
jgi:undecaprenyl-diphosphatase